MQARTHLGSILLWLALGLAAPAIKADVVTVVSAKSAITTLSKEQIANIFLGRSSRYPDGTQATPIDQPESSGTREEFYSKLAGKTPVQIKAYWSKIIFTGRGQPPRMVSGADAVKKFLSGNPLAISYIEASQVDSRVRALPAP